MPRQRIHHSRITYGFFDDFPERLVRFQEESKLPWAEINRRLDTDAETTRRWRDKDVLPNTRNYAALLKMADSLGLGHLLKAWLTRLSHIDRSKTDGRKPASTDVDSLGGAAQEGRGDTRQGIADRPRRA